MLRRFRENQVKVEYNLNLIFPEPVLSFKILPDDLPNLLKNCYRSKYFMPF